MIEIRWQIVWHFFLPQAAGDVLVRYVQRTSTRRRGGPAIEHYDQSATANFQRTNGRHRQPWLQCHRYDKNGDGMLTAEEIANGIGAWQQSGVGARPVPFVVLLERPALLAGATVTLVPANFLNDALKAHGRAAARWRGTSQTWPRRIVHKMPRISH